MFDSVKITDLGVKNCFDQQDLIFLQDTSGETTGISHEEFAKSLYLSSDALNSVYTKCSPDQFAVWANCFYETMEKRFQQTIPENEIQSIKDRGIALGIDKSEIYNAILPLRNDPLASLYEKKQYLEYNNPMFGKVDLSIKQGKFIGFNEKMPNKETCLNNSSLEKNNLETQFLFDPTALKEVKDQPSIRSVQSFNLNKESTQWTQWSIANTSLDSWGFYDPSEKECVYDIHPPVVRWDSAGSQWVVERMTTRGKETQKFKYNGEIILELDSIYTNESTDKEAISNNLVNDPNKDSITNSIDKIPIPIKMSILTGGAIIHRKKSNGETTYVIDFKVMIDKQVYNKRSYVSVRKSKNENEEEVSALLRINAITKETVEIPDAEQLLFLIRQCYKFEE